MSEQDEVHDDAGSDAARPVGRSEFPAAAEEPSRPRPGGGSSTPREHADREPDAATPVTASEPVASEPATSEPAMAEPADAPAPQAAAAAPVAASSALTRWRERRAARKARPRRKAPWWELPALVLLAVGIAIAVKSFVVQPFYIPSDSMSKTLHGCPGCHGDRILVNKPIYSVLRDPEAGDIVVFDAPQGWNAEMGSQPPSNPIVRAVRGFGQLVGFVPPDGQVLVKRVIAVGGQTVRGDAQGHVSISTNGVGGPYRTLSEPYVYAPGSEGRSQTPFGPVTVPSGRLWVMGDHRTDSADSRYHCSPGGIEGTADDSNCNSVSSTVPVGNVIGKAFVIAWPPSRWTTLGTPGTFESAAALAGPTTPLVASAAVVAPLALVRRRRRRR